jgi:hypothetical protein
MALYCFATSVPFKVGSASIAAEAFCMAISIESALGGMLGGFRMSEAGWPRKNLLAFTYWWPSPNKRSGVGASRTIKGSFGWPTLQS